eukprot:CAMPEP_0183458390 /NCGR_PEP_ID=MMETSP0370-20130417/133400_1 /TAXON_ID=268820 /ORGANISM="Peridinium aciculiferum, Strain PAER-2" /LENGTH=55 /DNA_ID=CAMNT_0025650159 /DNA_START=68 /DNA_END=232 /DNA_ORIENTATION=+
MTEMYPLIRAALSSFASGSKRSASSSSTFQAFTSSTSICSSISFFAELSFHGCLS